MRWLGGVLVLVLVGCGATTRDPCSTVTCGSGRCVVDQGQAACLCDEGFSPLGLMCVPKVVDPCTPNPCENLVRNSCTAMNGVAVCSCRPGTSEIGGACRPTTACSPNPCTAARQTVCASANGSPVCSCDPGYAPLGTGCATTPVWNCAAQHSGGPEDPAEPDECPTQAPFLAAGGQDARSLAPAGDHDWFALPTVPGHVYLLTATVQSGAPSLLAEVFGPGGVEVLSSDTRGTGAARVHFLAPAGSPIYARIRALSLAATCTYTVMLEDQGLDDYGADAAQAPALTPGATFAGVIQYPGDEDVVRLTLPANTAVSMRAPDAGTELLIDVLYADGGFARTTAPGSTTAVVKSDETVVLRAHGRNRDDLGPFVLVTQDLGPDDHGDDEAWATPVTATGQDVPANFERSGDVDVLSFVQAANRIYQVQCAPSTYGSCNIAVVTSSGAPLQVSSPSQGTVAWKAATSGTVFVALSQPAWGSTFVAYTWRVEDVGTDDHSEIPGTPVAHGVHTAGRIELPADIDGFTFTAVAGHVMRVATTTNPGLELTIDVYGPNGAQVTSGETNVAFPAIAPGVYRAALRARFGSGAGSYTVLVTDDGTDDHGNTASSATALTMGMPTAGVLQYQADVDVFSFSATAGHVYAATCGPYACQLSVRSPVGAQVSLGYGSAANGLGFLATASGTWTIEVAAASYPPVTNGAYTITVVDSGAEDHGEGLSTATALTLATPASGRAGFAGDKDLFSHAGTGGRIYRCRCEALSGTGSCTMRVLDSSGQQLGGYSSASDVRVVAPPTGTLYVEVSGGYSGTTYDYTVTVTDEGVDDHGNAASSATPLTVGVAKTGILQYLGDVDVFSVALVAGQLTEVTCTAASPGRCGIQVRSPSGSVVRSAYDSAAVTVGFVASVAGTWTIELASSSTPSSYTLTSKDLGTDDHGDNASTGTALTVGAAATAGDIEVGGDVDVFTFTAAAQRIMRASCTSPGGRSCNLTLRDAGGASVASTYSGVTAQAAFLASSAAAYSIEVRGNSTSDIGAYTIRIDDAGVDDHGNTVGGATPITTSTVAFGTLEYASDVDAFSTPLLAGTSHSLVLSGSTARVQILNPGGGPVDTCYAGSTCTFSAVTGGTYSFSVSSYSWTPGLAYSLTVY